MRAVGVPKRPEIVAAFNEWMRRFTADPAAFEREWLTVQRYQEESGKGAPSYGETCMAYLEHLVGEARR